MTDAATAQRGIRCVECGYDLRGLDTAGRCPECGMAIRLTLDAIERGDLSHANRPWLQSVAKAPLLLLIGLLLWNSWTYWPGAMRPYVPLYTFVFVVLGSAAWCCLALWRLGSPEPDRRPRRLVLRGCLRGLVIAYMCLLAVRAAALWECFEAPYWLRDGDLSFPVAVLSVPVVHFRLAQLAVRARHQWLARQHKFFGLMALTVTILTLWSYSQEAWNRILSPWHSLIGWGEVPKWYLATGYARVIASLSYDHRSWWIISLSVLIHAWLIVLVVLSGWWLLSAAYRRR